MVQPRFPKVPTEMVPLERLARLVAAIPLQKWAPLNEVFPHIKTSLGSNDLAAHALTQDLHAGRLTMAAWWRMRGADDMFFVFKREFWEEAEIAGPLVVAGETQPRSPLRVRSNFLRLGRWYLFLDHSGLKKLYPAAVIAASERRADHPTSGRRADEPPRRKPGPKPDHDWQQYVRDEVADAIQTGVAIPSGPELAQRCELRFKWQPDIREIQRFLRRILGLD